jgi:hypothetical protein
VNHPRGVGLAGDRLYLSSIYDWFQADFGGSEEGVLRHLQQYAGPDLAGRLKEFNGKISYDYGESTRSKYPEGMLTWGTQFP